MENSAQYARKICIVTPNYLSSTPRVVKEADALHDAGFDVRVVFSQGNLENVRAHDAELLKGKGWTLQTFGWSPHRPQEKWRYHGSRYRHFAARKLPAALWSLPYVVETAEGRVYPELARLAAAEPADLYIGHYLDGLAAAAYAARRWNALLGYDAEDLHTEFGGDELVKKRAFTLEQRYIVRCAHVTAASDLMAQNLSQKYHIPPPTPIYNVFPWSDRDHLDGAIKDRRGDALSIYWYSQTIGLDRGIQDAVRAMGLVDAPIQLHLRGALSPGVQQALMSLASENGCAERLFFHERVSPDELLSRAVEHDIGLAAEPFKDMNNGITVSNKICLYLLAGLAVAATDVPGQRLIMDSAPNAGYLYPVGDYTALAAILRGWIAQPESLQRSKAAALEAARSQWNWELESQKLVALIRHLLEQTHPDRSTT